MITMEQIRQQYPHPEACPTSDKVCGTRVYVYNAYCIGGAVCRAAWPGDPANFPKASAVAKALTVLNPALNYSDAYRAARDIMQDNDGEDFAGAWQRVHCALTAH